MSLISPEAMGLIERVEITRSAFAAEGLSQPAADILIDLGIWRPMSLLSHPWFDGVEQAGLATRIALRCELDGFIYLELERFCREYTWPD